MSLISLLTAAGKINHFNIMKNRPVKRYPEFNAAFFPFLKKKNIKIQDTTTKMLTKYTIYIISIVTFVITGCDNAEYSKPALPDIDYYLTIIDSIGEESGDSNCVIWLPKYVSYTPDGNIAVCDMLKHGIFIYSQEGEHIRTIGRRGEGPGEFFLPNRFSFFLNGGLLVSDANGITHFDSDFCYHSQALRNTITPPVVITALENDYFIGQQESISIIEEEIFPQALWSSWVTAKNRPSRW